MNYFIEARWLIASANLAIVGADNGLPPVRCQAIIWTNTGLLSIQTLGIHFNEILIKIFTKKDLLELWWHRNAFSTIGTMLPDGTKPLSESMFTYHQRCSVAFKWVQNGCNFTRSAHKLNLQHVFRDYTLTITTTSPRVSCVNSLWPSDAKRRHRSGSTLAQVMACCLTAPSHYLSQCGLIISKAQWHSADRSFTRDTSATSHWN